MEKSLTISVLNGDLLGVTVETRVQEATFMAFFCLYMNDRLESF